MTVEIIQFPVRIGHHFVCGNATLAVTRPTEKGCVLLVRGFEPDSKPDAVPVEEVYIPLEYKDAVQCANAVVMIQEADHETAAVMLEFQRNTYCYGDDPPANQKPPAERRGRHKR